MKVPNRHKIAFVICAICFALLIAVLVMLAIGVGRDIIIPAYVALFIIVMAARLWVARTWGVGE